MQPEPTPDMFIVARFHAIFEELNQLFSTPGFNPTIPIWPMPWK